MTSEAEGSAAALLDVNVLIAMVWDQHVHHGAARRNFASVAGRWATTSVTESGLVRLLLTPAVVGRTVSANEALAILRGIRSVPGWTWWPDDASFADSVIDLSVLMGRRQVTDLHLVDLAARRGGHVVTFDARLRSALVPADRDRVVVWST